MAITLGELFQYKVGEIVLLALSKERVMVTHLIAEENSQAIVGAYRVRDTSGHSYLVDPIEIASSVPS